MKGTGAGVSASREEPRLDPSDVYCKATGEADDDTALLLACLLDDGFHCWSPECSRDHRMMRKKDEQKINDGKETLASANHGASFS
jgi:hypothetical protein